MKTALFVFLIVASISAIFGESIDDKKQICKPKSTYQNYCNKCFCSPDGLAVYCSRKYCDPVIWNADGTRKLMDLSNYSNQPLAPLSLNKSKQVCKPKTPFKKDCNYCACSDDGTVYACTKMACPKGFTGENPFAKSAVHKRSVRGMHVCEPNQGFKLDCNHCWCNSLGTQYSCTRALCPTGNWNEDDAVIF